MIKRAYRLLSLLLVICIVTTGIPIQIQAANEAYPSVRFSPTPETTLASVRPGDGSKVIYTTKGGKEAWQTNKNVTPKAMLFIYVNVDDQYIYGNHTTVDVEVEYFDDVGGGAFTLVYNSLTSIEKEAEKVVTEGSGVWKTHTFHIEDANFKNALNDADFRIAIWGKKMGASPVDVSFASVTVKKVIQPEVYPTVRFLPTPETVRANVRAGDGSGVIYTTKDGKEAWQTNKSATPKSVTFIYVNVDDQYIYGNHETVEVEVEYFDDAGGGAFTLAYNSFTSTDKEAEKVVTEGSGTWKKHTFYLEDANFKNSLNNADFRIAIWGNKMGMSPVDVSFASVTVKKVPSRDPVKAKFIHENIGEIYSDNAAQGEAQLNIELINTLEEAYTAKARLELAADGQLVLTQNLNVDIGAKGTVTKSVYVPLPRYGVYDVTLKLEDASRDFQKEIQTTVSRIRNVDLLKGNFGVCTHFSQNKGEPAINLPLAKQIGMGWIRDETEWAYAETTKGQIDILPSWDQYINEAMQQNQNVLLILRSSSLVYGQTTGDVPYTDEAVAAYENYAYEIANHFKGKVNYFEVWNEMNLEGNRSFNANRRPPEDYVKLLKAASAGVKRANPDAKIVGMATAGADIAWMKRVLAAGGYDYMDIVSIHPYQETEYPDNGKLMKKVEDTKALFRQYGGEKPIWLTEIGWANAPKSVGDYKAAIYAGRLMVMNDAYHMADNIFWYDFQDDGANPSELEQNWGLIRTWKNIENPYAAKKGYVVVAAANALLGNYEFDKTIVDNTSVKAYLYKNKSTGKGMAVMWGLSDSENITLQLPREVTKYDMYGNPTHLTSTDGLMSFHLNEELVYVEGDFTDAAVAEDRFTLSMDKIEALTDDSFDVVLRRVNTTEEYDVKVITPEGFQPVADFTFQTTDTEKTLTFIIPANVKKGEYTVEFQFYSGGTLISRKNMPVYVNDIITAKFETKPVWQNGESQWMMYSHIRNNSRDRTVSGYVTLPDWDYPLQDKTSFANLLPGEERIVPIPLKEMAKKEAKDISAIIDLQDGTKLEFKFPVSFLAAEKAVVPPVIDGVISPGEWQGGTLIVMDNADQARNISDWSGVDDLSATGMIMWDEDHFYFQAAVTDNVHYQSETSVTGGQMWRSDSIQLSMYLPELMEENLNKYLEVGLAKAPDKDVAWRFTDANADKIGLMNHAVDVKITQNGSQMIYELAIPWKEVFNKDIRMTSGMIPQFSMLVNDSDGQGRKGWMEYGGGIGTSKDPSQFLNLFLVEKVRDANLSGLELSADPGMGNTLPLISVSEAVYAAAVTNSVSQVYIRPTVADNVYGTLTVNGAPAVSGQVYGPIALNVGNNVIKIRIAAEVGQTVKDYEIIVTRAPAEATGDNGSEDTSLPAPVGPSPSPSPSPTPTVPPEKPGAKGDTPVNTLVFADVKGHWADKYVHALAAKGIIQGRDKTNFDPEGRMTRAEFVSIIVRAFGLPKVESAGFMDVAEDSWYAGNVNSAYSAGLITGKDDKIFAPNDFISREEMAVIAVRVYNMEKIGADFSGARAAFADAADISGWAAKAVDAAYELGIIQGANGGLFAPKSQMTRAEGATLLYNLLVKLELLSEQ